MLASYKWLRELTGTQKSPEQLAEHLTSLGLEIEGVEHKGEHLDHVVVAQVKAKTPHESRDKLTVVTVFDGTDDVQVVCGAKNVPEPGGHIIFAQVGAELPGNFKIGERKLGGVMSRGMICSESELNIGEGTEGIFVFEEHAPEIKAVPGMPVLDALGLFDVIFEVGLTPNRPDCLGHLGLAREVCLGEKTPFRPSNEAAMWTAEVTGTTTHLTQGVPTPESDLGFSVSIESPERCPGYGAARVTGARVVPSPWGLRYRLHTLGLRPRSNIVDATNYIMLKHGHPIHGFDLNKVAGSKIEVRQAKEGETLITLDEVERKLSSDDLLICDGEKPVALAGVMGGQNSEIGDDTHDVLIECAYFQPQGIRRSARRHGMHTDASHRFERGVDHQALAEVLASAANLIARLSGGQVAYRGIIETPKPIAACKISFRPTRLASLLGVVVGDDAIASILTKLQCQVSRDSDTWKVTAPTHRPDLTLEEDLVEEVARVHGYDQIPTTQPRIRSSKTGTDPFIKFQRSLRSTCTAAGMHEAVSYSFVSPKDLMAAHVSTDAVTLQNPLSEERSVMRTSLLPGLAAALSHAQRHGVQSARLFEIGRVFEKDSPLPKESLRLSMLIWGERPGLENNAQLDFFDLKGMVKACLPLPLAWVPEDAPSAFAHPKRCGRVSMAGHVLGLATELHPDVVEALGLIGRPLFCDLSVEAIFAAQQSVGVVQATAPSKHPSVNRDIAMVTKVEHLAFSIQDAFRSADPLISNVHLFDLYDGEGIPEGHRSLAFRVEYRHPERTLTDKEVDKAHKKLAEIAKKNFAATIR